MTGPELRELMSSLDMSQGDMAWLCGVDERTVRYWVSGQSPVPQAVALLILAYDEGRVDASWLARRVARGVRPQMGAPTGRPADAL